MCWSSGTWEASVLSIFGEGRNAGSKLYERTPLQGGELRRGFQDRLFRKQEDRADTLVDEDGYELSLDVHDVETISKDEEYMSAGVAEVHFFDCTLVVVETSLSILNEDDLLSGTSRCDDIDSLVVTLKALLCCGALGLGAAPSAKSRSLRDFCARARVGVHSDSSTGLKVLQVEVLPGFVPEHLADPLIGLLGQDSHFPRGNVNDVEAIIVDPGCHGLRKVSVPGSDDAAAIGVDGHAGEAPVELRDAVELSPGTILKEEVGIGVVINPERTVRGDLFQGEGVLHADSIPDQDGGAVCAIQVDLVVPEVRGIEDGHWLGNEIGVVGDIVHQGSAVTRAGGEQRAQEKDQEEE